MTPSTVLKYSHHTEQRPATRSGRAAHPGAAIAASLLLAGAVACGAASEAPQSLSGSSLYAVMYEVYDADGSTSYLSLLDSLDIDQIDPATAREYGSGRAFVQAYNGWLFVGDAATPTVTRYSVGANSELLSEGVISFANYGLREGQFDSWNATFISPTKAYLFDFAEGRTIIWNPSTLEIIGEIPPASELYREGLSLEGTPAVIRDGVLFRTFNWVNRTDAIYSTDLLLATYDVETDQLIELVPETRCPAPGNLVHTDEAGNIYFSNWIWPVAGTLMRGAPESCVLRVNAGESRFDPNWTLSYADYTDGRQGAMFSYLQNGQALVSAFYDERTTFDATTDPYSYVGSTNWRIWNVDVEGKTGAPVEGIDFNGGAFTPVQVDGRLFLMVPGGEAEGYATQLYELVDGRATPYVQLPGWSYQFVKLR
jgi:hypothetical protein